MKERDKAIDGDQGAHMPPLGTKNFRIVGDPDAHDHRALPGLYEVTFPACEVKPVGHQLRIFARMAMRGPLECQVPRSLAYELDVTGTFATIRQEFRRLGVPLTDADGAEEACKALLLRDEHVNVHRFVDGNANSALRYAIVTAEDAKALLKGLLPTTQKLRIAASLLPPPGELNKDMWTPAVRKKMSREIIAWATILRCDASPLPDKSGYEVAWEAHIDNYLDHPLIHRWTQRVENVQAYEELRRDLEVLCVDLESYGDIENACPKALGQNIIVSPPLSDIAYAKHKLLEHFTKKPHQLPPLQERMTRAEAEEYLHRHHLEPIADNLREMCFVDEIKKTDKLADVSAYWGTKHICALPLANAHGPMNPLFGNVFDSYDLVQRPVEPYASDPIAQVGTYWLRATHCSFRQRNRFYYTHIRLEMANEEISPPFRAVYELKRKLTYTQLCAEFRKLQVIIHSKEGLKPACKSVLGDIAYARCLPEDAPAWMGQNATLN